MIIGLLLTLVFNILLGLIGLVPDFSVSVDFITNLSSILKVIAEMVQIVAFFLPLNALYGLLLVKISIYAFRIAWAIFLRIKSFIPTISST